ATDLDAVRARQPVLVAVRRPEAQPAAVGLDRRADRLVGGCGRAARDTHQDECLRCASAHDGISPLMALRRFASARPAARADCRNASSAIASPIAMISRAVGVGWSLVGEWFGSACSLAMRIRAQAAPLVRVFALASPRRPHPAARAATPAAPRPEEQARAAKYYLAGERPAAPAAQSTAPVGLAARQPAVRAPAGRFVALLRPDAVSTWRPRPSADPAVRWVTLPAHGLPVAGGEGGEDAGHPYAGPDGRSPAPLAGSSDLHAPRPPVRWA